MPAEVWAAIIGAVGGIIVALITVTARKKEPMPPQKNERKGEAKKGNILGAREVIDESIPLDERVRLGLGIKEIRVLNFASSAILSPEIVDYIGLPSSSELSDRIDKLVREENIKLSLIINAPESEAADEALRSGKIVNLNTDDQNRRQVFYQAYAGIQKKIQEGGAFYTSYRNGNFKYRITKVSLPYGIFQVKYKDSEKDHIKIDLYSPYISRESKRRAIYIYKQEDPDNYEFFDENFEHVFKSAMTIAEEQKYSKAWLEKAKEFRGK